MGFKELGKMLADQEERFQKEFAQLQADIDRMQQSYDELQKEVKEEEDFIHKMEDNLRKDVKALEEVQAEGVVNELIEMEGGIHKAIEKVEKEISTITGYSSKVSNRWDVEKGIEFLKPLIEEFEVLKQRFNQVDKKRDLLMTKVK